MQYLSLCYIGITVEKVRISLLVVWSRVENFTVQTSVTDVSAIIFRLAEVLLFRLVILL